MRKRAIGLAAVSGAGAVIAAGALVSAPAAVIEKTSAPREPVTGAFFNDPDPASGKRNALNDHLIKLIRGAAEGSQIRLSVFQLKTGPIADELVKAYERGVKVQIVADGVNAGYAPYKRLAAALGSDKGKPSWAMTCTKGKACIGTAGTPLNHNKFYLFSSTLGQSDVVVQSTANQTDTVGGLNGWNSAVAFAGNASLYSEYTAYFGDLAAMRKSNNYYNVRKPKAHGAVKTYFHPRATSDTMVNYLNYVACFGNTEGGTSDNHRTIIRVAMWRISRPEVAKKLWELDKKGCYVDIVVNEITDDSLKELTRPAGGYHGPEIRGFKNWEDEGVHEKNVIIDGAYNGAINQKIVFTGTHNMTPSSLRQNDESTLKIVDAGMHDQFRRNFWDVRTAADWDIQTSTKKVSARNLPRFPAGDDEDA